MLAGHRTSGDEDGCTDCGDNHPGYGRDNGFEMRFHCVYEMVCKDEDKERKRLEKGLFSVELQSKQLSNGMNVFQHHFSLFGICSFDY